ncbi:NlpC/P60 family peptidoglycan endopeptidase RipA (plasmid) [Mycolicibacterium vanbaalenii]|uniref:NlpC/P60 family peptidoglycan endopeptidase RipA n=1 Tax=Mycolicibacterium vanbaalenii TaxID=110539 RepID=UPI0028776265|nr:NlpC/P60 family peptidoglycan endopeptidase RipA [Mycolicibacterium vanbaalenii]WND60483.1 NlpC/P60 family peptidoglycan endopeptidase RipA [Mycolicibacterium vanbaalenii]
MRRLTSLLTTGVVFAVLVLHTSGIATAGHGSEPDGDNETVAGLVAAVAEANQHVADIGADIQHKQESVNRTLVELATAREAVAEAHRTLEDSEKALVDSQTAIDATQQRFDDFAASSYMNGPSRALPLASSPEDILSAASTQQTYLLAFGRVKDDLRRSQTERANQLSAAKQARLDADAAAAEAQRRQDAAVTELVGAQRAFADQQFDLTRLAAERDSAQTRLTTARPVAATAHQPTAAQPGAAVPPSGQWDRSSPAPADSSGAGQWDTTLPMVPSANVAGDPIAIINAVLKIMATSLQLTADMGRNFLVKLGILSPATAAADPGITNGRIPRLYGRQASEFVIRRAMSQLGVPYSWGGGNADGPSRGIDQGANTVGFDCSGLMLYAFAGVGIKLDHYSGSQYNAGRKVPSSQMQRGDLIFYGPNASQHEAMYLGDGMMLEAPYTGSVVKISPVRSSGMTPYVTRLIEY